MADDCNEQQEAVLLDVRARLQQVEDLIVENGWKEIFVRTNHGAFEWTCGAVEEPRAGARAAVSTTEAPLNGSEGAWRELMEIRRKGVLPQISSRPVLLQPLR